MFFSNLPRIIILTDFKTFGYLVIAVHLLMGSALEFRIVYAPAKLNLFLEVLSRRSDAYHEIETVMLAIDLCDRIVVKRSSGAHSSAVHFRCRWRRGESRYRELLGKSAIQTAWQLPDGKLNLAFRALERMVGHFSLHGSYEVEIDKEIPMGAGLGGASADAAGVLLGIAQLHGIDPVGAAMMELAGGLGSDVPFLLAAAAGEMRACIARGRGEILEPVSAAGDLNFVVHYPPIPLSTAEVYQGVAIGELAGRTTGSMRAVSALRTGSARELCSSIFNRLQEPACRIEPRLHQRLKWLEQLGSRGAWVTGSGSSCYGLAQSHGHARRIAKNLAGRGCGLAMVARPWGRTTQRQLAA